MTIHAQMLECSRDRVSSFCAEIERLSESEFAYDHSRDALDVIHLKYRSAIEYLDGLPTGASDAVVRTASTGVLTAIYNDLPLLGFILRSTNVRNAFEAYPPLLRLFRTILGPRTRLILSSEWNYSPLTYVHVPSLDDYILIGLPATESGNPMVIPLAGHELGHTLWHKHDLRTSCHQTVWNALLSYVKTHRDAAPDDLKKGFGEGPIEESLFAPKALAPAHAWALQQAEETFCDFIGLRLFSEAYLHAFAYLLSPSMEFDRSPMYPNNLRRVRHLKVAAERFGVAWPPDYETMFDDLPPFNATYPLFAGFLMAAADSASDCVTEQSLKSVIQLVPQVANTPTNGAEKFEDREAIKKRFVDYVAPSGHPSSLTAVLNAAWDTLHCSGLWDRHRAIKDKKAVLKELVLKSIEVLEFHHRISQNT